MLLISMILILMIAFFLMFLNLTLSKKEIFSREKISSFECGFSPLSSPRLPFSINFFLIGILFLIFDMEMIFIFPFIKMFKFIPFYELFLSMILIFMILYIGLEFEKKEGCLKWMM